MGTAAKGRTQIKKLLVLAQEQALPLRILRDAGGSRTEFGVVVGLSKEWVVLAELREGVLRDGYVAFRTSSIKRVRVFDTFIGFVFIGFVRDNNQWPPHSPFLTADLSDPQPLIRAALDTAGVISLYREDKHPEQLLIGIPVRWSKKHLWLFTINEHGQWEAFLDRFRLRDITRIGFGGMYERAVSATAGPMPEAVPKKDDRGKKVKLPSTLSAPAVSGQSSPSR
ncbi:hypothetical protein D6T63_17885 [Arthrobacter cheniae]|uniref:Uncharacterized protein n=1 Tax=Arthrobacter cheniae TaxID=1258888 RepID=A0A3A5M6C5_9MICC|nr:hypothetical protein [Arthrobacter cheniae]RJT75419.1 hypothetical protein D6T63_17885 [Arthrobacter cheniae]